MTELINDSATLDELWAYTQHITGKVTVTFPFNDYWVAGRVWTGNPTRRLKLRRDRQQRLWVQFDRRRWEITEVKALVLRRADRPDYRHLSISQIQQLDS